MKNSSFLILIFLFASLNWLPVQAGHPCVTDDAATVGTHKIQFELTPEFQQVSHETNVQLSFVFTYGISGNMDVVLGLPYTYQICHHEYEIFSGMSDPVLEVKWRWLEFNQTAVALKPGISFPLSRNESLSNNRMGYFTFLIISQEFADALLHANLGYIHNNNIHGDRIHIWHASLAGELPVSERFTIVANLGTESCTDVNTSGHPVFLINGFQYQIYQNIILDLGIRTGMNAHEPHLTFLSGITLFN